MHDAKGRELKVGDTVLIPAKVTSTNTSDACNLDVTLLGVMPHDGSYRNVGALNTKQVYRANSEDLPLSSIDLEERGSRVYLA